MKIRIASISIKNNELWYNDADLSDGITGLSQSNDAAKISASNGPNGAWTIKKITRPNYWHREVLEYTLKQIDTLKL